MDNEVGVLTQEESIHCIKVLRHKKGDTINITNGNGLLISATIINDSPKEVIVQKESILQNHLQRHYHLHLAVAPTKNFSRYEWFVEKASEFGIAEITPIITAKTEKKHLKIERLQKISIEAMKQSMSLFSPTIHQSVRFADFINNYRNTPSSKAIAWCGNTDKQHYSKDLLSYKTIVLIGPEGDFTKEELETAIKSEYIPISLGSHRLRTETAAVHLCSLVYHFYNTI